MPSLETGDSRKVGVFFRGPSYWRERWCLPQDAYVEACGKDSNSAPSDIGSLRFDGDPYFAASVLCVQARKSWGRIFGTIRRQASYVIRPGRHFRQLMQRTIRVNSLHVLRSCRGGVSTLPAAYQQILILPCGYGDRSR